MATIARPVKGKRVAVDRIRFDHTLLGYMRSPALAGFSLCTGKSGFGRYTPFSRL
jgi:hypothetical protein